MRAWAIYKDEMTELDKWAKVEARRVHPKQPRKRFDAENQSIMEGIKSHEWLVEFERFTDLGLEGIVTKGRFNLGTKKWADYRTKYTPIYGKIERETDASVMIGGVWFRKSAIVAVIY